MILYYTNKTIVDNHVKVVAAAENIGMDIDSMPFNSVEVEEVNFDAYTKAIARILGIAGASHHAKMQVANAIWDRLDSDGFAMFNGRLIVRQLDKVDIVDGAMTGTMILQERAVKAAMSQYVENRQAVIDSGKPLQLAR